MVFQFGVLTLPARVSEPNLQMEEPPPQQHRCQFWINSKRRFCANSPLSGSLFCGNHNPSSEEQRVPCPLDPSHAVLKGKLDAHVRKCPLRKQAQELEAQPFYQKGINCGGSGEGEGFLSSEAKRREIYGLSVPEFLDLIRKFKSLHSSLRKRVELGESYVLPEACTAWLEGRGGEEGQQLPFREKHALQQASILGNMEAFGFLRRPPAGSRNGDIAENGCGSCRDVVNVEAVVEFGAGRGYLTQMLVDCYGIEKVFLVERRSYKLKADRSLRQKESIVLERLRIDIEDLNLNGVEALRGLPYLAIGKHLCGPAIDKAYFSKIGIQKEDFNAMTWFSSWAVDGDHNLELSNAMGEGQQPIGTGDSNAEGKSVEEAVRHISSGEKASLGFICKDIIDMGRLLWLKEHGLDAHLVKYVPPEVSPENHLLVAKCTNKQL
ncbi:hypothetical protein Taro_041338 [Colocasia esculenta]|uniref:tRNA:m(4)X modification enzyme TRM13 n=1 Tax=Colocasia esculenta TaxID=4460 RepID=A0A843WE46_COLES|nr:hypothetical protein [Colocasia esculenta]